MTIERMLELQLLERYGSGDFGYAESLQIGKNLYNSRAILDRRNELREDFLSDYLIDSTSKED